MAMPTVVNLVEVGPRDGLQNETKILSSRSKIKLIDMLSETGLKVIEVSSMVNPKRIPQLADAETVYRGITRHPGIRYPLLVPNQKGLQRALAVQADSIAVFTSASETFCQKNIHCSIDESLQRFSPLIKTALEQGIRVRAYLSCVLGCPYEGEIKTDTIVQLSKKLIAMGCYEISLGDTIGMGKPEQVDKLLNQLSQQIELKKLAVHFHDTQGRALDNIRACLALGITTIDSAIAGLGGCPYAEGATGNIATEAVVAMLDKMKIKTGIDTTKLARASDYISQQIKAQG